ncbi:MAG TPA: PAS domain S-box protein [Chitinispirillaceae bacterium]|nr:PAS domain S-box protein [Chitinispirillaceae bacterium]
MITRKSSPPRGDSDKTVLSGRQRIIYILPRYALAVVSITAGLLLRFALEVPFGSGLPTYVTFYPLLMLTALVGGFGPGLAATILTLVATEIWIFPPVGEMAFKILTPIELAGFALYAVMGLFISAFAELYRRSRIKAAAYEREKALAESLKEKEFFADLLQNAEQPFAVRYLDGSLSLFNRAFETLTGYTVHELHSIDWATILTPPEWREHEKRELDELKATGKPVRYEKEFIRKDGSRVPVDLLAHIGQEAESGRQYYYVFITDLTERKKTEAEIGEANERLRQHASKIQAVNDQLRESRHAALKLAEDANLTRIQAEASSRELLAEITQRKKTEEKLRAAFEELAAANRDLESFSYSVSHDLRNPLHIIENFTDFLMEDYAGRLDEEGQDYIRQIDNGVKKMKALIDDILSLSRIGRQEMKREDVDLSAIVRDYLKELEGTDPKRNVEIVVQDTIHGNADPRLIHLALENLLRNAWKFTSKKEKTRIEFGAVPSTSLRHRISVEPRLTDVGEGPDEHTVYFIRDNGAGFDMQFAQKIFEPFKRVHADKEFTGTGIGLSIVQRVISRHGGKVWGEGEVGIGATFYFTLG